MLFVRWRCRLIRILWLQCCQWSFFCWYIQVSNSRDPSSGLLLPAELFRVLSRACKPFAGERKGGRSDMHCCLFSLWFAGSVQSGWKQASQEYDHGSRWIVYICDWSSVTLSFSVSSLCACAYLLTTPMHEYCWFVLPALIMWFQFNCFQKMADRQKGAHLASSVLLKEVVLLASKRLDALCERSRREQIAKLLHKRRRKWRKKHKLARQGKLVHSTRKAYAHTRSYFIKLLVAIGYLLTVSWTFALSVSHAGRWTAR